MKFELIWLKKYTYLIHYAEGTSLRRLPPGLTPLQDLIIDFSFSKTGPIEPDEARLAAQKFALSLCRGKLGEAQAILKLACKKVFSFTEAEPLYLATSAAKSG